MVDALRKVGYSSAGTVEFLRDETGNLYFIEMNARIQVEHPVTEMVTGVDLVKSQIRVAAGERLEDVRRPRRVPRPRHRMPHQRRRSRRRFVPSPGRITAFRVPGGPGIRVDTAAYADAVIPPYYDSLVAKLIAHGRDRAEAIARMKGRSMASWSKASRPPFRCTSASSPSPISSPESSTLHFLDRLARASSEVTAEASIVPSALRDSRLPSLHTEPHRWSRQLLPLRA